MCLLNCGFGSFCSSLIEIWPCSRRYSLYWAFCLFCAQCYIFKKFGNYAACDDRFANMKQKKVDHSKRLSAFSFIEKYRSYFKERKVKINILIYCKTRIWNRERKQYILGISLKPVGEKKETFFSWTLSQLSYAVLISLFFFFSLPTPLLSGNEKLLSRPGAECVCKFFYMVYSGLLRSFPQRNTTNARKLRSLC